jgi:hypothetical protein
MPLEDDKENDIKLILKVAGQKGRAGRSQHSFHSNLGENSQIWSKKDTNN